MDEAPDYIRAMRDPAFYPQPVAQVAVRETHISWVFLTGSLVYKVKKPVDLGFLDFSAPARREHFCRQEVDLNRRLARDVYLGVATIMRTADGYRLDGHGAPVDYAVRMRQLSSGDTLKRRLPAGRLDAAALEGLAGTLVAFYEAAATGGAVNDMGAPQAIARNCEENFAQTAGVAGRRFDRRTWEVVAAATRGFLENHSDLLQRRVVEGRIRDGHGDLRTDHVYLTDDGIRIVDCIEFNERFRWADVACDLAFLAMEMDEEGFASQAAALIDAFVRRSGDLSLYGLLDFYKCYRAMVRLKVNCLRLAQADVGQPERETAEAAIERFLVLAYRYAVRFSRPVLWVVWGMAAAGKSTRGPRPGRGAGHRGPAVGRGPQTAVPNPCAGRHAGRFRGGDLFPPGHGADLRQVAGSGSSRGRPGPLGGAGRHLQPSQPAPGSPAAGRGNRGGHRLRGVRLFRGDPPAAPGRTGRHPFGVRRPARTLWASQGRFRARRRAARALPYPGGYRTARG